MAPLSIRFLTELDLNAYRELRLEALQESPTSFGNSYEQESKLPLQEFAARLRPHGEPANGILGAFTEDKELAGTLGFAREHHLKRAHMASVWGMYVLPRFRGRGIGAALLDEALAHARGLPGLRQVILTVTDGNLPAISLYKSRGFERFGLQREALFVDGRLLDEEHMALHLSKRHSF
jgi:RimJ/RimL family protein N-acetyltransferase